MIPKHSDDVVLIRDVDALERFTAGLSGCKRLAVDTEFARETTYFAELCLAQIASDAHIGLIDTLAIDDLSALATIFREPSVTKIFHAGAQDMEVIVQRLGVMPAPIFDTQIAAAMLGHGDQLGYAALIEQQLGVILAKAHTRTDWRRRPLPDGALDYAADDVRYLIQAYPGLRAALVAADRLHWLIEDCERLADPARHEPAPSQAWRRLRGLDRLEAGEQLIAASLAEWREHTAIAANRPRRWIVADDVVLELARRAPSDKTGLATLSGLASKTAKRHGDEILACIAQNRDYPAPEAVTPPAPDADTKHRIKSGMRCVRACADDVGIPASLLASKADVAAVVDGRDNRLSTGWRATLAGEPVARAVSATTL